MAAVKLLVALFILTVVNCGTQVVHHVDRASDTPTDVGRVFRVGDSLLFKYLSPQETFVELSSLEEYYSCDLTNPIKMYTKPLNQVVLQEVGIRYFASGSYDKCKKGVKLPVQVRPRDVPAHGPSPSSATHFNRIPALTFIGLFVYGLYSI